jgi:hypothetical protein
MDTPSTQATILFVGSDDSLLYLLTRYAEQSGCPIIQRQLAPSFDDLHLLMPSAIIFSSLEQLHAAQTLVEGLSGSDTLILACVALVDEALAQASGADSCLVHPLTYDDFRTSLASVCPKQRHLPGFETKTSGF